jgi:hypothetical protein
LQPLGGIAGDMFVAAMLDAFPHCREQVFADIAAVLPRAAGAARLKQVLKNGVAALHFSLDERSPLDVHAHAHFAPEAGAAPHAETVDRPVRSNGRVDPPELALASHGHHHHSHGAAPVSDYAGLRKLIQGASLSGSTALHALAILEILARAESHIHRVALEKVHFHELAAWDSLMDVVAAGSVISALGEATWSISALPLGSGQVQTQHGLLPVPAPATMQILQAYPWHSDSVPGERVTPTGAAIVRHLVPPEQASIQPDGVYCAAGYGAGTKNFAEMANILRVMVFEREEALRPNGNARTTIASGEFQSPAGPASRRAAEAASEENL